jgi:hypothetical protein
MSSARIFGGEIPRFEAFEVGVRSGREHLNPKVPISDELGLSET